MEKKMFEGCRKILVLLQGHKELNKMALYLEISVNKILVVDEFHRQRNLVKNVDGIVHRDCCLRVASLEPLTKTLLHTQLHLDVQECGSRHQAPRLVFILGRNCDVFLLAALRIRDAAWNVEGNECSESTLGLNAWFCGITTFGGTGGVFKLDKRVAQLGNRKFEPTIAALALGHGEAQRVTSRLQKHGVLL